MENENKRFANILIPLVLLFMMKLIAQINIFFPQIEGTCLKHKNKRYNPLLSKSTLKYLVYYQAF